MLSLESWRNLFTARCTLRYPGCWNIIHPEFLSYSVPQLRDENLKWVLGAAAEHCYRFSRSVEKMLRSNRALSQSRFSMNTGSSSPSKTHNYPPRECKRTSPSRVLHGAFRTPFVREDGKKEQRERTLLYIGSIGCDFRSPYETFTTFARGIGQGQPRRGFDGTRRNASSGVSLGRRTGTVF